MFFSRPQKSEGDGIAPAAFAFVASPAAESIRLQARWPLAYIALKVEVALAVLPPLVASARNA